MSASPSGSVGRRKLGQVACSHDSGSNAEYSYVHARTLDICMLKAERDVAKREVLGHVLETNLSRIEEGYDTIQKHFKPGEHGQEFMEGFSRWTENTIGLARDLLGRGHNCRLAQGAAARSRGCASQAVAPEPVPNIDTSTIRFANFPVVFDPGCNARVFDVA